LELFSSPARLGSKIGTPVGVVKPPGPHRPRNRLKGLNK
jgi:hypothetical protein